MRFQILKTSKDHLAEVLRNTVKVDKVVNNYLADKGNIIPIVIKNIPSHIAIILKQEMLSIGTDAAIPYTSIKNAKKDDSIVLFGTVNHYRKFKDKLAQQPFGLAKYGSDILKATENYLLFEQKKTQIVGILNITPDSFYDGGRFNTVVGIESQLKILEKNCDIIDIGAQSSRPYSKPVSEQEEIKRLDVFFDNFKVKVPLSLDTNRVNVLKRFSKKVDILNDITALSDKKMLEYLLGTKHKVVLMHMKGVPENMQRAPHYNDVIDEILQFFEKRMDLLAKKGIDEKRIIIDPGIGFGKKYEDNKRIIAEIDAFKSLGFPIMIGHSNKSFLKNIESIDSSDHREYATAGLSGYFALKGIDYVRVHNAIENRVVIDSINKILRS